jgi:hypothetical protein
MKILFSILFLGVLFSCTTRTDFYVGIWELNKTNGASTLTLSESGELNLEIQKFAAYENLNYQAVEVTHDKADIIAGEGWDCIQLTLHRLTENLCIGNTYKCYIDGNMIDEVFLARKNGHAVGSVDKPEAELIVLPDGYVGEFFIVYQDGEPDPSKLIYINDKGIGFNAGSPELRQLFNANRFFRYAGEKGHIPIVNPRDYKADVHSIPELVRGGAALVVVQKGFNQSGRAEWNEAHEEGIEDGLNIEYFEIRLVAE